MKSIHGIIFAVVGAIAFGTMPLLAKVAYSSGTGAITVVFLRFFLAALMLLGYFLVWRIDFRITKKQLAKAAFLGVVGYAGTSLTLFSSYQYISVGLAMALHFIYPSLVAFLSLAIYKERLGLIKVTALVLSAIGIYILIGLGEMELNMTGVTLALASGLFFAIAALEIGKGQTKNINNMVLTFYLCLFAAIGALGYGVITNDLQFKMDGFGWLAVGSLALVCTVFAVAAFSLAVRIIGSSKTAILNTFEPVTSIILGALLLGEELAWMMVLGSFLIIIAAIIFCLPSAEVASTNCPQEFVDHKT